MTHLRENPAVSDEVNKEQRRYWTNEGQQQYQQHGDRFDDMVAPFGHAMLDAAQLRPGHRVLDVGCGYATTTIEAAGRVTPSGRVLGVDISAAMLRTARRRVAATGLDHLALLEADAQVHAFDPGSFDAVISRFGTMFFDDPEAAFANLARALRPGGRLAFVCWQDRLKSEWVATALGAVVPLLGRPPELGTPGAPCPWAFADGDRLERLLTAGGFRDVRLETVTRPQRIGDHVEDAVGFVMSLPESQQLFAGAPEDTVAAAAAAVGAAFMPHAGAGGVVFNASAWLVSARR
jgi:SAM-dependent methyltransferase